MELTPERLAAVYEMLRSFPPFSRWKLPPASEVKFHTLKTDKWQADWWIEGDTHHVRLSEPKHHHLISLIASMAHEMVHVQQRVAKTETRGAEHNDDFKKRALQVCKAFGFDYGQFG